MADDQCALRMVGPPGRRKDSFCRGIRGERVQRAKIHTERRCGLLGAQCGADQDASAFRQARFQPGSHVFGLLLSLGSQFSRHVGNAVFSFRMSPQYQFHLGDAFFEIWQILAHFDCKDIEIRIALPTTVAGVCPRHCCRLHRWAGAAHALASRTTRTGGRYRRLAMPPI